MITFQRDMILISLISESGKDRVSAEQFAINKSASASYYYFLYEESMEKKKKCEGDFFIKIFSPESKDLK
ncbi:hypothetical protein EHO98_17450 [Leptospira stimsonii]|uniref:Transposase n=1 Tax=Leptospira stimsonii TaxID=2202203 RepID=A0ABY2MU17_9LEPT|nr:hypothetical protein EHO98_17450 [Leptospira stimsonii]TGM07874.1 hypothetical protein EHQ90_23265 [Leptospira stimsonii]